MASLLLGDTESANKLYDNFCAFCALVDVQCLLIPAPCAFICRRAPSTRLTLSRPMDAAHLGLCNQSARQDGPALGITGAPCPRAGPAGRVPDAAGGCCGGGARRHGLPGGSGPGRRGPGAAPVGLPRGAAEGVRTRCCSQCALVPAQRGPLAGLAHTGGLQVLWNALRVGRATGKWQPRCHSTYFQTWRLWQSGQALTEPIKCLRCPAVHAPESEAGRAMPRAARRRCS